MGRYDKIKYRNSNNTNWLTPTNVKIRNATNTAWVDLGDNTSYNTKDLNVRNSANSLWFRATLNRQDITEKYIYGPINKVDGSGALLVSQKYNNTAEHLVAGAYRLYFSFIGYIYIDGASEAIIFGDYANGIGNYTGSHMEISVNTNNYLQIKSKFGTNAQAIRYSYQTIPRNQWVYLEVVSDYILNGTANNYLNIRVDGGTWYTSRTTEGGATTGSMQLYFQYNNYSRLASYNLALKGFIEIKTANGLNNRYTTSFNIQNLTVNSLFDVTSNDRWLSTNKIAQYIVSTNWI